MADYNASRKPNDMDEDPFEDESVSERLSGLAEMFPEGFCKSCTCAGGVVCSVAKSSSWLLRKVLWVICSSAVIMVLPVIFESERAHQHEAQLQQQRQILLGPNAAVSGAGSANLLPGMGMVAPQRSG